MGARAAARVGFKPSHLDIVKISINIIFPTIFVGVSRVCISSLTLTFPFPNPIFRPNMRFIEAFYKKLNTFKSWKCFFYAAS